MCELYVELMPDKLLSTYNTSFHAFTMMKYPCRCLVYNFNVSTVVIRGWPHKDAYLYAYRLKNR